MSFVKVNFPDICDSDSAEYAYLICPSEGGFKGKGRNKMSFMNLEALSNSIDFNVNSIYDVFVYFVDIASDCLIESRFVDCIDAYGLRDVLEDGVFYVPGAMCLGYRVNRW